MSKQITENHSPPWSGEFVGKHEKSPELDVYWPSKRPKTDSPVRSVRTIVKDSNDPGYVNRLLIATPVTGLVRVEWVGQRYGQTIPTNWSMVQMIQWMSAPTLMPTRYQVDDAQNMIVKELIEKDFEWLLLIEHDVILPNEAFIRFNDYMLSEEYPIVSGLYFTRFRPSEPLVYRGRGNSFYSDFEIREIRRPAQSLSGMQ